MGGKPTYEELKMKVNELENALVECKTAKKSLGDVEIRYRSMFEYMHDGVAVYEAVNNGQDFIFRDFNKAGERIDNIKRDQLIGKSLLKMFPGVKEFGLFEVFQRVWITGEPEHHPITQYEDNRIRGWRNNFVYKLPSAEIVAIYSDETERKQAEEALKDSEERFRLLYEKAPLGYHSLDDNGHLIEVNHAWLDALGYTREEVIGRPFRGFLHPELVDKFEEDFPHFKSAGQMNDIEFKMVKKDGSHMVVSLNRKVGRTEEGKFKQTHCIMHDITEQREAEEALRESEERFRSLFQGAAEGIAVADIETKKFKYINPALCNILGYAEEEFKGFTVEDIHPKESLGHVLSEFESQARGEKALSPNIPCLRKDGSIMYADINTAKVLIAGRSCNVGFFTDITDRKHAEEALRKREAELEAKSRDLE
jgi:PAS domain S-box-containing protein